MARKILKNKPLVEAIFELRWDLQEMSDKFYFDPHYKIMIGRLYEKLRGKYPHHEQLGTAIMPDQIAGHVVQHRFRKAEAEWPVVQFGPGVITLNDTEGYVWEDFRKMANEIVNALFDLYPKDQELRFNALVLRYIDAITFDFENEDIIAFLRERMKINLDLHPVLFDNTGVVAKPQNLDLKFSFPSSKPSGTVSLRFFRGKRNGTDSLLWETIVESVGHNAPKSKEDIIKSLDSAHDLTDDWFFKIISGELEKRFE